MDLDLYLLDRAARTAVYFIGQTLVEPDPELLAPRDLNERRFPSPALHDAPQRPGPLGRIPRRDQAKFEESVTAWAW